LRETRYSDIGLELKLLVEIERRLIATQFEDRAVIFKMPKTIFNEANVRGVAQLQQSLDKFFCEVKEIRRSNMIFSRRLKRILNATSNSSSPLYTSHVNRIVVEVMLIQKLAFTDHAA
jgi:hypothetical protein